MKAVPLPAGTRDCGNICTAKAKCKCRDCTRLDDEAKRQEKFGKMFMVMLHPHPVAYLTKSKASSRDTRECSNCKTKLGRDVRSLNFCFGAFGSWDRANALVRHPSPPSPP